MGVKLTWQVPDTESTFNTVYIYRATTRGGSYSEIANQTISDNTYYDMAGSLTHWYKVRFYDSSNIIWSDYSDPIQGGQFGGYCSVDDVKEVATLSSDVTDIQIFKLIRSASLQINHDIQVHVDRENIAWVNGIKTNDIDGSNTIFYTKEYPLGDRTNDYTVYIDDVKVYKQRMSGGDMVETELTVSAIDPTNGKVTLSSAPESDSTLYISYVYTPREYPIDPVHELIKQACAYLAAYLIKNKVDDDSLFTRTTLDRLTIVRQPEAVRHDYDKYLDLIQNIKSGEIEINEEVV